MRFVSKFSNYRLVLKQGMPAEPMTGRAGVNGIYVKFEDGMLDTGKLPSSLGMTVDEVNEKLLNHPQFQRDFLLMEETKVDPYALTRRAVEPEHDILTIEHGGVGKSLNPKMLVDKGKQEVLIATAKEMAKSMAKEMLKEMMADMAKEKANVSPPSDSYAPAKGGEELMSINPPELPKKKGPGRPPKDRTVVDAS